MKKPEKPIPHPGQMLANYLKKSKIKQATFASQLDIAPSHLNEILKGSRTISPDLAVLLEVLVPDKTAKDWIEAQANYQLDVARQNEENRQKVTKLQEWQKKVAGMKTDILTLLKKADIIKGNSPTHDLPILEKLAEIPKTIDHYRKSEKHQFDNTQAGTWKEIVKYRSQEILMVTKFDKSCQKSLIENLRKAFSSTNIIGNTNSILAQFGIKLVIQPKFPKMPIDGYAFWIGDNPTIGLTLRYKRIDNFAFNVMHELGHIFLHLKPNDERGFIDGGEIENEELENQANEFARNQLISADKFADFLNQGEFADSHMKSFAESINIHPAIIRGRLCFEGYVPYQRKTSIINTLDAKVVKLP